MMDLYSTNLVLFSTALGFSAVASYFDLKTGEIPDKFTVGLVVVALALRVVFSLFLGDPMYLIDGLIVGALFFGFGALLFYTGGWGGGDAKLIAGVGASLGGLLAPSIIAGSLFLPALFGFFVALSMVAIPYSLSYAVILSFRAPGVFALTRKRLAENRVLVVLLTAISISLIIIINPHNVALMAALLSPAFFYPLVIFTKSVEEVAMQKEVSVGELREGDMVAEDIVVGGKKIASKRDMDGLSKAALEKIKAAKLKKIRIKWGIRFAPAFPLAILVSPCWNQILLLFI